MKFSYFAHAFIVMIPVSANTLKFTTQSLGAPFEGQHTGTAFADLNNDGHTDVLFSAGRHWVDQPFALMNLGIVEDPNEEGAKIRFSKPVPIGNPGGYTQIDTTRLSSIDSTNTAVILAGGICRQTQKNQFGSCKFNSTTPAVLLDVIVTGCTQENPETPCKVEWTERWVESNPQGNRNGAFSLALGDGTDPAIVLTGFGTKCVTVYEPQDGGYYSQEEPTFALSASDIGAETNRCSGLSVGYVRNRPGLVAGPTPLTPDLVRSPRNLPSKCIVYSLTSA